MIGFFLQIVKYTLTASFENYMFLKLKTWGPSS